MALIKTIAEIKEVVPDLVININSSSLIGDVSATEEKHLVPLIGDALYNDIQTKFNAGTLSDAEKTLLRYMRLVIAPYALQAKQVFKHVFMTDQGIRVAASNNLQKAVGWEYKKLEDGLSYLAVDGKEALLKYMFRHKADLPLWTASDEYKQFEGLLIRTSSDFDGRKKLFQPTRTFFAMGPTIKKAQKFYLISGLGEDLLYYLVKVAAPATEEKAIIEELKDALAHFTVKHACEDFEVRFDENGFTITSQLMGGDQEGSNSGRTGASIQAIDRLQKACDRDGKNFMLSAKRLLVAYRKAITDTTDFTTAFDKGPLKTYCDPKDQDSWNRKPGRKGFR